MDIFSRMKKLSRAQKDKRTAAMRKNRTAAVNMSEVQA